TKMRRQAQLRSCHLYRERCRTRRRQGKAPIQPRGRDMGKGIYLAESAPARDQMDAVSTNRATPAFVRARSKYSSSSVQTFPLAIFAPALRCPSNLLCASSVFSRGRDMNTSTNTFWLRLAVSAQPNFS